MKKWMIAASVLALVLCGAAMVSYAQGPKPHEAFAGGPGHGPGMGMLHELNLTDAQKAQVKQIMQANHATMKPLMLQMEQNRAALLAATANGAYDDKVQATIKTLASQQAALEAQMIINREAIQHQIYTTVLTSDQQAQAEQLRTQQLNRITQHLQKMANGTDTPPPSE
jgi:periplasmic protein CpxP/Spy